MGKTKGFIEPKGSRRRVRVKTKGFIKPLALGFEFARGGKDEGKGGVKGFEFARRVRVFSSRALGGSMGLGWLARFKLIAFGD